MMTATTLIRDVIAKGIRLTIEGGQLIVDAPKGVLTPFLIEQLKRNKTELLSLLEDNSGQADEAVREYIEERAAIMEYDGGLAREDAQRRARSACRVFEYRLGDNPEVWLTMIAPDCELEETVEHLRLKFGDRFLEARPRENPSK